jgi:hypothetical protein
MEQKTLELKIHREPNLECTPGMFYINDEFFAYSLEDPERGFKIKGDTAIPKGRYRVILSMSARFKKVLPLLLNVPGYSGVRIHGGNTKKDTLGCPLIGKFRTGNRIYSCAPMVNSLILRMEKAISDGQEVYITIM